MNIHVSSFAEMQFHRHWRPGIGRYADTWADIGGL